MQIRQILATAAVAAVTAPVALLSVSPAFADTKPVAQTEQKPSIAELRKAVKEARQALKEAKATEQALEDKLDATTKPEHPLMVAVAEAQAAADKAAATKTAADTAVTEAQKKLDDAAEADKAAAEEELKKAQAAATEAATAKTDADAELAAAGKARDDARVELARQIDKAQKAVEEARVAKEAAEKALADARDDEPGEPSEPTDPDCAPDSSLKVALSGLPSKVAAGSSVDFKLSVTNTSERTLDEVLPYAEVAAFAKANGKDITDKLHLKAKQGGAWKTLGTGDIAGEFTNVKSGAGVEVPLRLTIDRSTPAGEGVSVAAGIHFNRDESCGYTEPAEYYFTINPVGAGNSNTPADKGNKPKPQGSASPVANSGNGSADTDGSLAHTGSSSALPTLGLAGGAAVVLGAGAVYVVRRRKADANS
ncbi:LPXTG cell wall anchor domain-containing protein [Streptomyces endophyticus]|uniref:LPXTG cell wall anchor domain-containing protein n=1 Tax=Streptomyces endophyticus TaxID=714166 RepID=A0ABU6FHT3_9ACTN|nr:LPXTG cell wall anchor domain-containing protein [Streptomyces endophyticus]MEB8343597.1 LPXTG cell wall anchor domain-containing protein [Streptomyces endophyticus]